MADPLIRLPNTFGARLPLLQPVDVDRPVPQELLDALTPEEREVVDRFQKLLSAHFFRWQVDDIGAHDFGLPHSDFTSAESNEVTAISLPSIDEQFDHVPLSPEQLDSIWHTRKFTVKSKLYSIDHIWQLPTKFFMSVHDREKMFQILMKLPLNFLGRYNDLFTPTRWYYDYKWLKKGPNFFSALKNLVAIFVQLWDLFLGSPTYSLRSYKQQALPKSLLNLMQEEMFRRDFPRALLVGETLQTRKLKTEEAAEDTSLPASEVQAIKNREKLIQKLYEKYRNGIKKNVEQIRKALGECEDRWKKEFETSLELMDDCDEAEFDILVNNLKAKKNEAVAKMLGQMSQPSETLCSAVSSKLQAIHVIEVAHAESAKRRQEFLENVDTVIRAKHPYLKRVPYWYKRKHRQDSADFLAQEANKIREAVRKELAGVDPEALEMWETANSIQDRLESEKLGIWARMKETLKQPARVLGVRRKIYPPYKVEKFWGNQGVWEYRLRNIDWYHIKSTFIFFRVWADLVRWFHWSINNSYYAFRYAYSGQFGLLGLCMCNTYYRGYSIGAEGVPRNDLRPVDPIAIKVSKLFNRALASRARFEALPDTGLLGKNVGRIFNVLNCYVIRIFFGCFIGLLLIHPLLNLLTVLVLVCFGLSAWLWVLLWIFLRNFVRWFIFDFEHLQLPKKTPGRIYSNLTVFKSRRRYFPLFQIFFEWVFNGFFQLMLTLFLPFLYPILALLFAFVGVIIWFFRFLWDMFVYAFILRCCGKVPSRDTNFARRIAGPGVSTKLYYSLALEDVIILIQGKLEEIQLDKFRSEVGAILDYHNDQCQQIADRIIRCIVASRSSEGAVRSPPEMAASVAEARKRLDRLIADRKKVLPTLNTASVRGMGLKFTESELVKIKAVAETLLRSQVDQLQLGEFIWNRFDVKPGKYRLLTARFLGSIFSQTVINESADQYDEKVSMSKSEEVTLKKMRFVQTIVRNNLKAEDLRYEDNLFAVRRTNKMTIVDQSSDNQLSALNNPGHSTTHLAVDCAKVVLALGKQQWTPPSSLPPLPGSLTVVDGPGSGNHQTEEAEGLIRVQVAGMDSDQKSLL